MRPPNVQAFIDRVLPYAQRASAHTAIPISVVLAQWALESGWGSSRLAREGHNLGAITRGREGNFRRYETLDAFTEDWIRVLHLPYYDRVRKVASSRSAPEQVARALGESPYDAGHYRGNHGAAGSALIAVMDDFDLSDYDEPDALVGYV